MVTTTTTTSHLWDTRTRRIVTAAALGFVAFAIFFFGLCIPSVMIRKRRASTCRRTPLIMAERRTTAQPLRSFFPLVHAATTRREKSWTPFFVRAHFHNRCRRTRTATPGAGMRGGRKENGKRGDRHRGDKRGRKRRGRSFSMKHFFGGIMRAVQRRKGIDRRTARPRSRWMVMVGRTRQRSRGHRVRIVHGEWRVGLKRLGHLAG